MVKYFGSAIFCLALKIVKIKPRNQKNHLKARMNTGSVDMMLFLKDGPLTVRENSQTKQKHPFTVCAT